MILDPCYVLRDHEEDGGWIEFKHGDAEYEMPRGFFNGQSLGYGMRFSLRLGSDMSIQAVEVMPHYENLVTPESIEAERLIGLL